MRIVAKAVAELKKDKALFNRVLANADRIEDAGSQIAREQSAVHVADAESFAKIITSEAYSEGPLRAALVQLAKEVKNGTTTQAAAVRELVAAARARANEGALRGRTGDRAGVEGQGGEVISLSERTAAGEQILVPGVAAVSDRQRAELAGSKPLQGGDAPAGGMFDEDARAQEVMFRGRGAGQPSNLPPNQMANGRPVADQGTTGGKVERLEDLGRQLVSAFETLGREGRVTPGAAGQFNLRSGVIRVRSVTDFDTLAHEVGHSLHLDPADKAKIDPLIAAHAQELQPLGAGQGSAGNAEAFAELFRLYTVNRAYAAQTFPNATAALEALLRSDFPDQFKALDDIRASLDAIHRAPSGELVTADTISAPPPRFGDTLREMAASDRDPEGRTVYSALDALYTSTIDKLHPIYRAVSSLVAVAKGHGKTIDLRPADDAYVLARLLPGSHGAADTMLKHGVIPAGEVHPTGPSFSEAIEKALGPKWDEKGFADFGAYLTARRMVAEYARFFAGEIPNPPGKLSLADYQQAVAGFEAKYPSFVDAAQDVYGFLTNHLQRLFDKGLVSKEYFDAAMARVDYVPFVRDLADFQEAPSVGGGMSGVLRNSVMKAFRGSQRAVINPLESIAKRVHDLEFFIARNDVVNALDGLAQSAGQGSGAIAERVPSNQLTPQRVDVIEALKNAGKTAGVDDD